MTIKPETIQIKKSLPKVIVHNPEIIVTETTWSSDEMMVIQYSDLGIETPDIVHVYVNDLIMAPRAPNALEVDIDIVNPDSRCVA